MRRLPAERNCTQIQQDKQATSYEFKLWKKRLCDQLTFAADYPCLHQPVSQPAELHSDWRRSPSVPERHGWQRREAHLLHHSSYWIACGGVFDESIFIFIFQTFSKIHFIKHFQRFISSNIFKEKNLKKSYVKQCKTNEIIRNPEQAKWEMYFDHEPRSGSLHKARPTYIEDISGLDMIFCAWNTRINTCVNSFSCQIVFRRKKRFHFLQEVCHEAHGQHDEGWSPSRQRTVRDLAVGATTQVLQGHRPVSKHFLPFN